MQIWVLPVLLSFCSPALCSQTPPTFHKWTPDIDQSEQANTSIHLKCGIARPRLFLHPCRSDVAIYCNNYAYLQLSHNQEVLDALSIPQGLVEDDALDSVVNSFVFCNDLVFFVLAGNIVRLDLLAGNFSSVPFFESVTDVQTSCCCSEWFELVDNFVLFWRSDHSSIHPYFHVSEDGGGHYHRRSITISQPGSIESIQHLHSHGSLALLIRLGPDLARFHYYSHGNPVVLSGLGIDVTGNLQTILIREGCSEMLLWDERHLLYSANGGQAFIPVYELSASGSKSVFTYMYQARPFQILTNGGDTFAILTYEGELLFGKAGISPSLFKISDILSPSPAAYDLTPEGNIIAWSFSNNSGSSPHQSILVSSDVLYPLEEYADVCKHQSLTIEQLDRVHYLDIGMNMTLDVTYLPEPWMEDKFIISVENPNILNVHTDISVGDMVDHGVKETKLAVGVDLVASGLPSGQKESARGMSSIVMSIIDPDPACMASTSKTTHIVAGCPSNKNIRIRRTVEVTDCEHLKNYVYTIPREVYDPYFGQSGTELHWEDCAVTYDYWKLGCLHRTYHGFPYKPILELYEDDAFIKVVDADYVVIEAHGIHNFGYSQTAETAGCRSTPQNWLSMISQQELVVDPHTAWTRENCVNCFSEDGTDSFDATLPYEILNNNTANEIKFSQYNGIYIFNVTVLDPDYSFCQLRTQYAVEVFGAFHKSGLPPLKIILFICGFGLVFLIAFYVIDWFILRNSEDEDQFQSGRDLFPY